MSEQAMFDRLRRDAMRSDPIVVPAVMVRVAGAVLALAIAGAHVADQGGLTAFTAPDWLGWAYRLIEVGGVLTAGALIWPRTARLGWLAGVLLGVAPFLGFLASRTVGVPSDPGDVGNWSDWVGTLALVLEAGLVAVSVGMVRARLRQPSSIVAPVTRIVDLGGPASINSWDVLRPTSHN
jgi:Na+/proline symporter